MVFLAMSEDAQDALGILVQDLWVKSFENPVGEEEPIHFFGLSLTFWGEESDEKIKQALLFVFGSQ